MMGSNNGSWSSRVIAYLWRMVYRLTKQTKYLAKSWEARLEGLPIEVFVEKTNASVAMNEAPKLYRLWHPMAEYNHPTGMWIASVYPSIRWSDDVEQAILDTKSNWAKLMSRSDRHLFGSVALEEVPNG